MTFNGIIVYRAGNADSLAFAMYYADTHSINYSQLVSVPCSALEILPDYSTFQSQIENTLKTYYSTALLKPSIIIVGYGVPGGFIDGSDIISTTSRLSRMNHTYAKGMSNPLFARQKFKTYDSIDADTALIVSRIDAPTLEGAKTMVNNMVLTARQGSVNGKIFFDPFAPTFEQEEIDYQHELLDFEANFLPILNIKEYRTTFWDEYTDVVIPKVSGDSFMWAWKADRAGFTFFKDKTTARIFLYNGDRDGAASVRDVKDKRWPMLALSSGYAAAAGAMSDPLPEGLLRPRPFFDALFRGSTIGEAYLFAVPNLDWTMTLFGDPLLRVKFPTSTILLDNYTVGSGFDEMGKNLQSSIAYYLERERGYVDAYNIIKSSGDITIMTELMPVFAQLANRVIAETKGTFIRIVSAYTKYPTNNTLSQYLFQRGDKISRLLPLITPEATVQDGLTLDKGYWEFEDTIQHSTSGFYKYTFVFKLANDSMITDVFLALDTDTSREGWFYEKDSNQFDPIPIGGIPSSYAGRRIRYVSSPAQYFSNRKVFYAQITQFNEFGETTPSRTFKQVVGT